MELLNKKDEITALNEKCEENESRNAEGMKKILALNRGLKEQIKVLENSNSVSMSITICVHNVHGKIHNVFFFRYEQKS